MLTTLWFALTGFADTAASPGLCPRPCLTVPPPPPLAAFTVYFWGPQLSLHFWGLSDPQLAPSPNRLSKPVQEHLAHM